MVPNLLETSAQYTARLEVENERLSADLKEAFSLLQDARSFYIEGTKEWHDRSYQLIKRMGAHEQRTTPTPKLKTAFEIEIESARRDRERS